MKFSDRSILEYIERNVINNPEKIAIIKNDSYISYKELWKEALKVSSHIQELNIRKGSTIAVIQEEIENALPTIIGIIHSGCIYIPISPTASSFNIKYMIDVGKVKYAIVDCDNNYCKENNIEYVSYYNIDEGKNHYDSRYFPVAYIMFTSGSTGKPKGIAITHENLTSIYKAWQTEYHLNDIESHLQIANLSFDVFAGDWIRALCSGATLVAMDDSSSKNPDNIIDIIIKNKVECAEFTPIRIREIYQRSVERGLCLDSFKLLICGSDTMRVNEMRALKKILNNNCRLIFSYGTTETTIDSSFYELNEEDELVDSAPLPIGNPFKGTEFKIVSNDGFEGKCGSIGELYICGSGVGAGYIEHVKKTTSRYIRESCNDKFIRWYRTGDLASFDGKLYWLHGRADSSIKIQEKFVDLTEVEAIIRSYEGVLDCVVVAVLKGSILVLKTLVVYMYEHLCRESLIGHIVESATIPITKDDIVRVERLPMTLSGKIDRKQATEILSK